MKKIVFIILLFVTLGYGQRFNNTEGDQVIPLANSSTNALLSMPFDESAAMDSMRYFYTAWDTVASEDSLIYVIYVDGDTTSHLQFEFFATLGTLVELYEGNTWSDSTLLTENNYNFNTSDGSAMDLCSLAGSDSISAAGTKKIDMGFGTANTHYKSDRLVLKNSTRYMLLFISLADNNVITIKFDWFDHVGIH